MNSHTFVRNLTIVITTLVIFSGTYSKAAAAPVLSQTAGQKQLGDLELRTTSGEQISLFQYITRKAIVVVFWAAWCPICHGEAPRINKINADPNVKVIAVNEGDSTRKIKDFIAANKVSYQVVLDPVSDVAKAFGVPGMPFCVIIGRSGTIVYRGYKLPEDLDSYIK